MWDFVTKLRSLYAEGKLMLPETFIGTQLQCRLPSCEVGANDADASLLWKWANGPEQLAEAIEQPVNRKKVLAYLHDLRDAGLLGQVPCDRLPSCFKDMEPTAEPSPRRRKRS